jgi:Cdc6-like AAA superfamily ATPase
MPPLTRFFVNRTSEIDKLNAALHSKGAEKDSFVLIYGQQGIGKTQLLARYLRECNDRNVRIAYVDLESMVTKGYLGLIDAIVEGLGSDGFEELDKTYDDILFRFDFEQSQSLAAQAQDQLRAGERVASGSSPGMVFDGPLNADEMIFINGQVDFKDTRINYIFNFDQAEPAQVAELHQRRITRVFADCLRKMTTEQLVIILLDHWDKAGDPIQTWLNDSLLEWATDLILKRALIVVSRDALPPKFEDQMGVVPLAIPPFSREIALEFWKRHGLAEEEFPAIGAEIYGMPGILSLEVGKWRVKKKVK